MTATAVERGAVVDAARFVEPGDAFRTAQHEGTYRTRSLPDTLDLLWRRRAEVGVSRVWEITGLDRLGLPVFAAARPDAYRHNLTVSNGKGLTRTASLVSALAEAFERHWAEPDRHELLTGSLAALEREGRPTVHPRDLGVSSTSTWDESTPLTWLELVDLADGAVRAVPAEYAVAPYLPPGGVAIRPSSTDGIAAGNTPAEATLHALMELVERDACSFGLWTGRGWEIDATTLPASALPLVQRCEDEGIAVRVFEFPSVIDCPVLYVTLDDRVLRNPMLVCAGAGAHADGEVALTRALTEAVQSRACAISGGREDLVPKYADNRAAGYESASAGLEAWAARFPRRAFRRYGSWRPARDAGSTVRAAVDALGAAGMAHVYARELSPPEGDLHVVSVVVPGLELVADRRSPAGPRFRHALREAVAARGR